MLAGLAGIGAASLMYWLTAHNLSVWPDSLVSIEAAQNVVHGNGFAVDGRAKARFPPVYPLLLARGGLLSKGAVPGR